MRNEIQIGCLANLQLMVVGETGPLSVLVT